jgi:hypothetical protein
MNGKSKREPELMDACVNKHISFFLIDNTGYLDDSLHR